MSVRGGGACSVQLGCCWRLRRGRQCGRVLQAAWRQQARAEAGALHRRRAAPSASASAGQLHEQRGHDARLAARRLHGQHAQPQLRVVAAAAAAGGSSWVVVSRPRVVRVSVRAVVSGPCAVAGGTSWVVSASPLPVVVLRGSCVVAGGDVGGAWRRRRDVDEDGGERARRHVVHLDLSAMPRPAPVERLLRLPQQDAGGEEQEEAREEHGEEDEEVDVRLVLAEVDDAVRRDGRARQQHVEPRHLHIQIGFYRAMLCIRGTSHGTVFVRLSVTSRSSTKTAKRRITQTTPHDSPGTLSFLVPKISAKFNRGHPLRVCALSTGDIADELECPLTTQNHPIFCILHRHS